MLEIKMLLDILAELGKHYWFSGLAGFLGFLLTLTILYVPLQIIYRFGRPRISMAAKYGMIIFPLLVGASLVLLSHWALDSFSIWYTTPLGEPLIINK